MKKLIALCAVGALAFAACGDDDDSNDTPATTEATAETEAAPAETEAAAAATAPAAAETEAPAGTDG